MAKFQKGRKKTGGNKKGSKHKKTIAQEMVIEFTQKKIRKELEPILETLIDKCKMGDISAIKEALDRLLGKVKETKDINIKGLVQIQKIQDYMRRIAEE